MYSFDKIIPYLIEENDSKQLTKLEQLIKKLESGYVYITFCGHFSAGKSSLINQLCGHRLLPSSPIPTSANIVSISDGQERVMIKLRKQDEQKIVNLDLLEEYCVNGTDIESIEIQYPIPLLNKHMTLLDTPGIDSTDESHFSSTDAALHLADLVFYVMDYNHVMSEVNFNFAKRLQDLGKPLYLIINQMDKHKESELPFTSFVQNVKEAFSDWNIVPQGYLYTSVKYPDHPNNELEALIKLIRQLPHYSDELRGSNAYHSIKEIIKAHTQYKFHDDLIDPETIDQKKSELKKLEALIYDSKNSPEKFEKSTKQQIRSLLDNANITPALTRDVIHHFLQSRKPGFQVGFLFRSSKTEVEMNNRLIKVKNDITEQVSTQLENHLMDFLRQQVKDRHESDKQLLDQVSRIKMEVTTPWIKERVQSGGVFSDEYTMTFATLLSTEIKEFYRNEAFEIIRLIKNNLELNESIKQKKYEKDKVFLTEEIYKLEQRKNYKETLEKLVNWEKKPLYLPEIQHEQWEKETPVNLTEVFTIDSTHRYSNVQTTRFSKEKLKGRLIQAALQLKEAYTIIEEIPAMESVMGFLFDKSKRLEESQFTIALFGAFSAGKSSFANALLGERVLPVSPNPTTAAINKIRAPYNEFIHGTTKIVMKTEDKLWREVQFSLQQLGYDGQDMQSSIEMISAIKPEQISGKGKPHFSFLKAVAIGWQQAEVQLGKQIFGDMEKFRIYAANESKSCFVELIELYYACPFTEAGFILVDTPGADSINARHTGVAFEYIKNADLILFVTYYNHAFSQADREFLLQLGRVKDSFELDKMFFIINAADLASSEAELKEVIQHLDTNLLQYGIRNPQIYPISSILAAEGKERGDLDQIKKSGIESFEADFLRFTSEELLDLAVTSANQEIIRSIQILEQRLKATLASDLERNKQAEWLEETNEKLQNQLNQYETNEMQIKLESEIKELLYYVKQRVHYRYGELFNMAFNPSDLRDDASDTRKIVIEASQVCIRSICFTSAQEILASTLRIENFMNKMINTKFTEITEEIKQKIKHYHSFELTPSKFQTPQVTETFENFTIDHKLLFTYFKSAKYFFEGKGKEELKQKLERLILEQVGVYVDDHTRWLTAHYLEQMNYLMANLISQQKKHLEEYINGYVSALNLTGNQIDFEKKIFSLKHLIS